MRSVFSDFWNCILNLSFRQTSWPDWVWFERQIAGLQPTEDESSEHGKEADRKSVDAKSRRSRQTGEFCAQLWVPHHFGRGRPHLHAQRLACQIWDAHREGRTKVCLCLVYFLVPNGHLCFCDWSGWSELRLWSVVTSRGHSLYRLAQLVQLTSCGVDHLPASLFPHLCIE